MRRRRRIRWLRRNCTTLGVGAVSSHVIMWAMCGTILATTYPVRASELSQVTTTDDEPRRVQYVLHDSIVITLPVFVVSIISTAVFTWTVSRLVHSRDAKMAKLARQVEELQQMLTWEGQDTSDRPKRSHSAHPKRDRAE